MLGKKVADVVNFLPQHYLGMLAALRADLLNRLRLDRQPDLHAERQSGNTGG